jgi:hypothetical protein
MIYALWHGGASYSVGELDRDLETFPSIRAAGWALRTRANNGHWYPQDFTYADGRTERALTPCADKGCEMTVYLSDPRGMVDPHRDYVLSIGPHGGIRQKHA